MPDLYDDEFSNTTGMEDGGSGSGQLYDIMGLFSRFWGYTDHDYMMMPVRRRRKLTTALIYQLQKIKPIGV